MVNRNCRPYKSYALVSQLKKARGFDLADSGKEAMTPIAGKVWCI